MATHTGPEVDALTESALEHLWVYLREPSDMAEKGEPQILRLRRRADYNTICNGLKRNRKIGLNQLLCKYRTLIKLLLAIIIIRWN